MCSLTKMAAIVSWPDGDPLPNRCRSFHTDSVSLAMRSYCSSLLLVAKIVSSCLLGCGVVTLQCIKESLLSLVWIIIN